MRRAAAARRLNGERRQWPTTRGRGPSATGRCTSSLLFGGYRGLPLKILWTLIDGIAIVVLANALYFWTAPRKTQDQRLKRLIDAHERVSEATAKRVNGPKRYSVLQKPVSLKFPESLPLLHACLSST